MTRAWTLEGLAALYALSRGGADLGEIAEALGRFREECDRALWTLVGRTPEQALGLLNSGLKAAAPPMPSQPPAPRSGALRRFIEDILG